MSVALQMVTNDGDTEGLFRAAFMQSGSPLPFGDITHGQYYYDYMVNHTSCSGASDTLQCLREVPYTQFKAVMDTTPTDYNYEVSVGDRLFMIYVLRRGL